MDMRRRDRGVAGGDRDLVEVRYDIFRSIDAVDRRPLMDIDLKASDIVGPGSQRDRKFGSNPAAERRIDHIARIKIAIEAVEG